MDYVDVGERTGRHQGYGIVMFKSAEGCDEAYKAGLMSKQSQHTIKDIVVQLHRYEEKVGPNSRRLDHFQSDCTRGVFH